MTFHTKAFIKTVQKIGSNLIKALLPNNYLLKCLINQSYNSINFRSLNGEYRSNTAERCRLRRSRTPVNARTPAPSAVFMSPSPNWMTHSEF